jgi:hypothetical protein
LKRFGLAGRGRAQSRRGAASFGQAETRLPTTGRFWSQEEDGYFFLFFIFN